MTTYQISLVLTILIAFGLRFYNLDYHSLWFDEALSVHWARQSVPRILEVGFTLVEDRLPPLYYLMLKGWTQGAGFSEVGVRSLTVFIGTLQVPVVAAISSKLFNRQVAILAALLTALNPFLIWYAQEARMYAPAALFSTLSVWAFLQMVEKSPHPNPPPNRMGATRPARWERLRAGGGGPFETISLYPALFAIFSIAGLYSHLYAGFLLPALGLWLLIGYRRNRPLWLRFAVAGSIITLAYLPILLAIWRFSGEAEPGNPFAGLGQRAWWLISSFTIWKASLHPVLQFGIPGLIAIFAILAIINFNQLPTTNYELPKPTLLVSLLLLTPFFIATALLSRNYLAFFGERYFIVMTPWLLILAAIGVTKMMTRLGADRKQPAPRLLSLIPIVLVLLGTIWPLPGHWQGPATKEFWRQSVDYLAEQAGPGDGILIHPDWVRYPFQFYFSGPGQTYAAFSDVTPATALDEPLQGVVGDHEVIWLIQSHLEGPDPDRLVEQWFTTRYPLVTELYPPGIALKGYATGYQLPALPDMATPTTIEYDNGLKLVGFEADRVATATDDFFHPPSGWLHVVLYWTAGRPVTTDVVPVAQLVGPEGVWGASLDRASDALKLFPPSRWPVNSEEALIVRQDLDINLNPATPPGRYQVVVGLPGSQNQHTVTTVEVR